MTMQHPGNKLETVSPPHDRTTAQTMSFTCSSAATTVLQLLLLAMNLLSLCVFSRSEGGEINFQT